MQAYSSLKVQIGVDDYTVSKMVILLRYNNLPTQKDCDILKVVQFIADSEGLLAFFQHFQHIYSIVLSCNIVHLVN